MLGNELLLKAQEMMKKGYGNQDEGTLPEDEIQQMLIGANRIMDYALSLDIQLICLKQHALHVFNSAVTGDTCHCLLDIPEAIYGYPESVESRQQGMTLITFSQKPGMEEVPVKDTSLKAMD